MTPQEKSLVLSAAVEMIAVQNGTISGPTEEAEDEYCIYRYEKDALDTFLSNIQDTIEYEIVDEFTDGNGDDCIVIVLKS